MAFDLDDDELRKTLTLHGIKNDGIEITKDTVVGIVRKMDELGRVVIPKEMRKVLCIEEGCNIEIICLKDGIFLRKVDKK